MSSSDNKKILIIGATSSIVYETAKYFAIDGASFYLIARNEEKLLAIVQDLVVKGAKKVEYDIKDVYELKQYQNIAKIVCDKIGGLDIVLIGHGMLGDPSQYETNPKLIEELFDVNFISYAYVISYLIPYFISQKSGVIAVISSVAGDRGRGGNYAYHASKAALSVYTEGLRARLFDKGVHVLTIKPGLVSTPMTQHLKQGILFANPQNVGKDIYIAILKHKNELYTPWFWKIIMFVIKHIPACIIKRMKL